jgi:hypothetical protein
MATVIGAEMPAVLMERLRSAHAAPGAPGPAGREFTAVPVCTVDAEGFPHPAMLSFGELAADDPRTLRAAVFGGSRTARHLRERGRMTLLFVEPGGTYYVKARAAGGESPHPGVAGVAVFSLSVVAVLADAVDTTREPAAEITSGIRFTRAAPGTLL